MEPRFLGGVTIIAKSFARIHETNLKKQGLLPLIFVNPSDYDKIEATDRVSILDLAKIAPKSIVKVRIKKADGKTFEIDTRHTLTEKQVSWFKAGSALNAARMVA